MQILAGSATLHSTLIVGETASSYAGAQNRATLGDDLFAD
jgi:hypothetical protein